MMTTLITLGSISITNPFTLSFAYAEQAKTSVKNAAEDVKTDTKKGVRKMNRKGRKIMGTDNLGKDAKDQVNDWGDDAKGAHNKAKNKMHE